MTTIFAVFSVLLASAPGPSPAPTHPPSPRPAALISPDELFSRRALRQARLLIQLRILQLRDERLECVREALRRQLPSVLWPEEPSPSRGSANTAEALARCSQLLQF